MVVEELVAKLGLEVDGATFKVAEQLMAVARGGMMAIGAAAVAAAGGLALAVAKTAQHADAIEKAAQRTGIGVEALQALQYAAERADVGAEGLQASLNFMAKRGVKDFEAELRRAADELSAMPDGGEKAARAMQLFGKQGAMLIPMLNKGSAGLDEMTQLARDAGIVLGEDMVASGAGLKDALEDLQAFVRGLAFMLAGPLLKPVRAWVEAARGWIRANREIIALHVERTLAAVGKALGLVFRLAEPVVDILFNLVKAASESKAALIALGAVGVWLAAPFLAPVAAIGLLLMAIEEVWGWVTGKRRTLLEDAFGPFSGITGALDRFLAVDPKDSALVAGLKYVAQVIFDIQGSLQKLDTWMRQDSFLKNLLNLTGSGVGYVISGTTAALTGDAGAAQRQREYVDQMGFFGGRAGMNVVDFAGRNMGPGSSPSAFAPYAPPAGGPTLVLNGGVTLNAAPGTDGKALAGDFVEELNRLWDSKMSSTLMVALPAARGP